MAMPKLRFAEANFKDRKKPHDVVAVVFRAQMPKIPPGHFHRVPSENRVIGSPPGMDTGSQEKRAGAAVKDLYHRSFGSWPGAHSK